MTAKKASDKIWFRHAAWCCILANQGCVTPAPSPAPLTNETRDTARQGGGLVPGDEGPGGWIGQPGPPAPQPLRGVSLFGARTQ